MSDNIPIIKPVPETENDERLLRIFEKIEENQLDLLDQSGKRIVELTGVLLGILLGVTSFGDKFPPDYIEGDSIIKLLVVIVLVSYMWAMLWGMLTTYPRKYRDYRRDESINLSGMRDEFDKMVSDKINALRVAGASFLIGSASLALLLGVVIVKA